ncbi:G-protein coupled receptor 4, partial [Nibea albiflora]
MEDLHMNNTSQKESFNYSNMTDYSDYENIVIIEHVVTYIIIGVGLPLILVAISTLYCQVRNDHVAPIYVINLLISDLIQFCCFIIWLTPSEDINKGIAFIIYRFSVMASVGFMVCVALERYLLIAWPLWYRFRRTIKTSVVVCVVVWIFPLVCVLTLSQVSVIIFKVYFLFLLPLLLFFLGGRYMNNISQDYSFNYNSYDYDDYENAVSAQDVMTYIIISVGLP